LPDPATALPSSGLGGAWLTMAGGLFIILALLLAMVWLLKRYGPKAGLGMFQRGDLKLEGQLGLGPKKSVAVVRFLNKVMVLGVTDSRITLLTEIEEDHDQSDHTFHKNLQQARRKDDSTSSS
jgi:flagellar protein FliO/FliZ